MVRTLHILAQLVLLASALCLAGVATAALKNKPPEGLKLSGTEWQIDPYHSDDPVTVIIGVCGAASMRKAWLALAVLTALLVGVTVLSPGPPAPRSAASRRPQTP